MPVFVDPKATLTIKGGKLKTDFVGYILIVDDDEQIPTLIRSVLRPYGHYIEHANSAIEAEKMMQARVPDLVLLDNEMPVKSGIQFLTEIRDKEDFQFLPVIIADRRCASHTKAFRHQGRGHGFHPKTF